MEQTEKYLFRLQTKQSKVFSRLILSVLMIDTYEGPKLQKYKENVIWSPIVLGN